MELLLPWMERLETKVWDHELLWSFSSLRQQIVLLPINPWDSFASSACSQIMRWEWQLLLPNLFSFSFLTGLSYAKFDQFHTVVEGRCGMEVREEQNGAAVMGSGLCVETQEKSPLTEAMGGGLRGFWVREGEMEVKSVHFWCIITCLEISGRGNCSYHVREGRQITHSEIIAACFISCYSNYVILAFALNYLTASEQHAESRGGKMQGQLWE